MSINYAPRDVQAPGGGGLLGSNEENSLGAGAEGGTAGVSSPSEDSQATTVSTATGMTAQNLDTALQNAFTTVNIFILILIMIAMGAKMKLKHIREHVQKPMGPLAGFISQFVIMPLVAFVVAHILRMIPEHAIGALIMACSPGGVMSNMVTFYTNGDCSLSITMTTLSTIMAFGMMPANLWLYTRSWTSSREESGNSELEIPYASILLSLLLILIPVTAGYMFIMKYPNMRGVVAQTGSFSGVLAIVISMLLFMFMHWNLMVRSDFDIWIATAAMPILGFVLGYILSALFCLSAKQKRTVGFETGCQNASIAFSVIATSFPSDVVGNVLLVPLLFCLFSFIEGWLFVIVWQLAKWAKSKIDEWKEDGWACVDWEESSDESDKEEEKESGNWTEAKNSYFQSISAALSGKMKRKAGASDQNNQLQSSNPSTPNLQRRTSGTHTSRGHQMPNGSLLYGGVFDLSSGNQSLRMTALSASHGSERVSERAAMSGTHRHNTHTGGGHCIRSSGGTEHQYHQYHQYSHGAHCDSNSLTRHSNSVSCPPERRHLNHDRLGVNAAGVPCQLSSSAGAAAIQTGAASAFIEAAAAGNSSVSRHHSSLGLDPRNIITDV